MQSTPDEVEGLNSDFPRLFSFGIPTTLNHLRKGTSTFLFG